MAKQKVRATRHNGRKGENGVFKAGHNDRSFDVDAAEHIDPSRSFMNVYWDMYQGYNISDANGVRPERRFSFEEIENDNRSVGFISFTISVGLSFVIGASIT